MAEATTLQEVQDQIHALYETSDTDTPEEGTDDWDVRQSLIGVFIAEWEQEEMWSELVVNLTDAADGTKTTTLSDTTYTAPTDFGFILSNVRVVHADGSVETFRFVPLRDVQLYKEETSFKYFYVTGNKKVGYTINIVNGSFVTGATIEYQYYKDAFKPTAAAHIIEMSIPLYLVKKVVAKLHEGDGEGSRASKMDGEANNLLVQMKMINNGSPWNQSDQVKEGSQNTAGFGG